MPLKHMIIIGGGIVGLASALKLAARLPGCQIIVLEKEADVGRHQSGNNSGVLHAGLSYRPSSVSSRKSASKPSPPAAPASAPRPCRPRAT